MANSIVAAWYQVRVIAQLDAQVSFNVMGWQCTGITGTGCTMAELASNLRANMIATYPALLTSVAQFRGVGAQQAYPPKDAESYAGGAIPGTAGAVPLPKQIAGVLSFYDGLAGPKHRGRFYLPFPSTAQNTADGVPTAAYVTAVAAWAAGWNAGIHVVGAGGTADFLPHILHRLTLNGTQATRYAARAIWGTQKKRGDYGRTNISPI
jgi:hypothetical protein